MLLFFLFFCFFCCCFFFSKTCREGESCNHVEGLLYQIHHWSSAHIKEIPVEKSSTSRPQKWHKPRGDKITPQPLMKLTFAKATTDRQQRKRDPVLCRLYDARAKKARGITKNENMDRVMKTLKSRRRNIPFSHMFDDRSFSMKESLFGEVPDGSPLSLPYNVVSVRGISTVIHYESKR